jgi:hypothetical protein
MNVVLLRPGEALLEAEIRRVERVGVKSNLHLSNSFPARFIFSSPLLYRDKERENVIASEAKQSQCFTQPNG